MNNNTTNNNIGLALEWDSTIENDMPDYVLLPEGEYSFEVENFERGRHVPSGNGKLPACPKAILHIKIDTPEGVTKFKHNLFLHSSVEGLLCAFFTCIGARKKGERVTMDWDTVMWAKGRAKVGVREYKDDKGETRKHNEIKRFLPPADAATGTGGVKPFTAGEF